MEEKSPLDIKGMLKEIEGGTMSELEEQIKVVAEARKVARTAIAERQRLLNEWTESNKDVMDAASNASLLTGEEEEKLRELTLEAYAETGNKTPAVGVGIREVTRLAYDSANAFSWATEHIMALKLDVSAFEKIAKASPLDFVTITQEPQATIATNLEID